MSDFQRGQTFGARLAGASLIKKATLLCVSRAAVPKVMTAHTNHGKISSSKGNRGRKPKLISRDRRELKSIVSKNHRTAAAKVKAELNVHLEEPVSTKRIRQEFHRSIIHGRSAIANPRITEKI